LPTLARFFLDGANRIPPTPRRRAPPPPVHQHLRPARPGGALRRDLHTSCAVPPPRLRRRAPAAGATPRRLRASTRLPRRARASMKLTEAAARDAVDELWRRAARRTPRCSGRLGAHWSAWFRRRRVRSRCHVERVIARALASSLRRAKQDDESPRRPGGTRGVRRSTTRQVLIDCIAAAPRQLHGRLLARRGNRDWRGNRRGGSRRPAVLFAAGEVDGTAQNSSGGPAHQPHRAELREDAGHRRARRRGVGGSCSAPSRKARPAWQARSLSTPWLRDADSLHRVWMHEGRGGRRQCPLIPVRGSVAPGECVQKLWSCLAAKVLMGRVRPGGEHGRRTLENSSSSSSERRATTFAVPRDVRPRRNGSSTLRSTRRAQKVRIA